MSLIVLASNIILAAASSPATGDTRSLNIPIIVGVVAVVLVILSIVVGKKPKDKDKK